MGRTQRVYDKKSRQMVPTGPPHAPVGVSKQQRANEAVQRCRARAALKASYNGVGDVPPELQLLASPKRWASMSSLPWAGAVPMDAQHNGRKVSLDTESLTNGLGPLGGLPVAAVVPNGRALDQAKAAATAEIDLKGYVDTERKF